LSAIFWRRKTWKRRKFEVDLGEPSLMDPNSRITLIFMAWRVCNVKTGMTTHSFNDRSSTIWFVQITILVCEFEQLNIITEDEQENKRDKEKKNEVEKGKVLNLFFRSMKSPTILSLSIFKFCFYRWGFQNQCSRNAWLFIRFIGPSSRCCTSNWCSRQTCFRGF
jgi:hypothetical protein